MKLFCYTCRRAVQSYPCEHCHSDDVEPYDTDGCQAAPDYTGDAQEPDAVLLDAATVAELDRLWAGR